MSPSIERFEGEIGRRVKKGDVLVHRETGLLHEVVEPISSDSEFVRDCTKTKIRTPIGLSANIWNVHRNTDSFEAIIKAEDRTDIKPSA